MKGNFWMLVSEKIQHACALILPKKSTSMCFENDMFALKKRFCPKSLVRGGCKKFFFFFFFSFFEKVVRS
jgi:hypothetical protein